MLDYKIKTFLTLCKYMNYRITAEKLNMSQPSVTQHIHLLEDYYNTKLFYYDKKKLYKTDSAIILEKNLAILVNNQIHLENQLNKNTKNIIKIGATKTIGNYVINKQIQNLINDKNEVTFIIDNTKNLLNLLNENELDLLIIEGLFNKSLYDYQLFKREEFVGICNINHKFANKEIDFEEILSQTLISREYGSGTRNILEQELINKNYTINSFKSVQCISGFNLIKDIIKNTDYITFAYKAILKNDELTTFKIKDVEIVREFNYVCLKNTNIEKKIKLFNSGN